MRHVPQGFPPDTLDFLRALRANNSTEWFTDHRSDYERWYLTPAMDFVRAAGEVLAAWRPDIQAQPRILGSVFRINRDARRAHAAGPYKDHIDFYFWEGERRTAASAYFMRLAPEFVGIGAGRHGFSKVERACYREALDDSAASRQLVSIVAEIEQRGWTMGGGPRNRSPAAARVDDPRATLRDHRGLFVHVDADPDVALDGAQLMRTCTDIWRALTPLHAWLVQHVQD